MGDDVVRDEETAGHELGNDQIEIGRIARPVRTRCPV
jgi:hypothetical protein